MTILHFASLVGKKVTLHSQDRVVSGLLTGVTYEHFQVYFHVKVENDLEILSANHYSIVGIDNIVEQTNSVISKMDFTIQEDYYRTVTEGTILIKYGVLKTIYDQLLEVAKDGDAYDLPLLVAHVSALNAMLANDVGNSMGIALKEEVVLLLKSMLPDTMEDIEREELYEIKVEERQDDSESFF